MSDDNPKVASLVAQFTNRAKEMKVCYKQRVPPKLVGIHPSNRDEYGVGEKSVHDLLWGIAHIGLCWGTLAPASFQETPDKKIDAYTRKPPTTSQD